MNVRIVKTLYKKELKDIFRDKKTILVMLLIPVILYPLMMFGSLFLTSKILSESTEKTYKIGILTEDSSLYESFSKLLDDSLEKDSYHFEKGKVNADTDLEEAVRNKEYDAIVRINSKEGGYPDYDIVYVASNTNSSTAVSMVENVLEDYKEEIIEEKLRLQVEDYDEITKPFEVKETDCATNEETAGLLIGMILPMMLIVSVLMGAFYPAIDTTAGEKERGTLETLMTLPVSNMEMMTAKLLSVTTMAVISALLNILSLSLMGLYMLSSIGMVGEMDIDFNVSSYFPIIPILLLILIIFACFTSAVSLCFMLFAKSFKEASNLSTPILLVFMFASMVSIIPSVELTMTTAVIPVVNITLLIKDLFLLKFDIKMITVVIASTLFFTVVAVYIMSKLFSSEDILFGDGLRNVKIFEKRANMKDKQMPGIGDAIIMFAILLILIVYLGSLISVKFGIWGTGIVQLIIFAVPVLYAWYMKADMKKLFSVSGVKWNEAVGTVIMFLGLFVIEQLMMNGLIKLFPSIAQINDDLTDVIGGAGFVPALIVVGFCPAIAEETAFRGFLFGTLKNNKKIPIAVSIVISALCFGAYHMNIAQFISASFIGIFIAYFCYNSGSIFLGCLYHFLNNTLSVVISYYPEPFEKIPFLEGEVGVSDICILCAVSILLIVLGFMFMDKKFGFFKNKK